MVTFESCGIEIDTSSFSHILSRCQKGEERYQDSLGWLDPDEWASSEWIKKSMELAEKAKAIADTFVVIGIGGSNNSVRALLSALEKKEGMRILYAGDTLSSHELAKTIDSLENHDFVIDCIAKNFETLEPGISFRIFRDLLEKKYGKEGAAERIFCTGSYGSSFETLAMENNYTFIPFPENIGGRYTALCPVHLFPMAAGGADIEKLAAGAKNMAKLLRKRSTENNAALFYAALRNKFYAEGYRIEILSSFEPRLRWFYKWWEQLFAESEGKENKGIFPVALEFSEELHSYGQFIQEGSPIMIETFLDIEHVDDSYPIPSSDIFDGFSYLDGMDVEYVNSIAKEATIKAHSERCPCMRITIDRIDEYNLGELMYFFEFACYLSCSIMGLNPFNQPGVEAYKKNMFMNLGKYKEKNIS